MTAAEERYFVGLASGPSADGIDAVLAAVAGSGEALNIRQVRYEFTPYEADLRKRIEPIIAGKPIKTDELIALDREVGKAFGRAAKTLLTASRPARKKLIAIGSGGQLLARPTDGGQLQVGSAAMIAERTGLPVVSDFHQADIAAGGRGGPVKAWADWAMLSHPTKTRVVVNLGAIATVTFLPAGGLAGDTLVFDAGPGTAVIDALARRHFDKPCDIDGAIAATATADGLLVHELMAGPFFARPLPRFADLNEWGSTYMDRFEMMADKHNVAPAAQIASASELTARAIVATIGQMTENPHEVLLAGGGAKNIYLAMRLRKSLTPASTIGTERLDLDSKAKTALDYALLAAARIDRTPTGIPQLTGADRPALLGTVTEV